MTDQLDTAAIRALKPKRSKCADVGNRDLSNVPESHETIWLQWGDNGGDDDTWCADNINDEDVPYIRADLVFALCDEVDRMRAEIERLRNALNHVVTIHDHFLHDVDTNADDMAHYARAALTST